MSTSSRIEPDVDSFEKSATFGMRPSPASNTSSNSESSTVSNPEQQMIQPMMTGKSSVTPMPAWLDISLAVMTVGLSVPAFHAIRGVSEKRAAKKAVKRQKATSTSASDSYLVPSSVVRGAGTTSSNTKSNQAMELDSSPLEPPPYSAGSHSQPPNQDAKAKFVAELP